MVTTDFLGSEIYKERLLSRRPAVNRASNTREVVLEFREKLNIVALDLKLLFEEVVQNVQICKWEKHGIVASCPILSFK